MFSLQSYGSGAACPAGAASHLQRRSPFSPVRTLLRCSRIRLFVWVHQSDYDSEKKKKKNEKRKKKKRTHVILKYLSKGSSPPQGLEGLDIACLLRDLGPGQCSATLLGHPMF